MTDWNMRPLGVQVLALAYRTRRGLERDRLFQPGIRRQARRRRWPSRMPKKRKAMMKDIEQILQDSGIIIQPYWRTLYNHSHADR